MGLEADLLEAFERHSPQRIREALAAGADPVAPVRGKAPVWWLVEIRALRPVRGVPPGAAGRGRRGAPNLEYLCRRRDGSSPAMPNVPNAYLAKG